MSWGCFFGRHNWKETYRGRFPMGIFLVDYVCRVCTKRTQHMERPDRNQYSMDPAVREEQKAEARRLANR